MFPYLIVFSLCTAICALGCKSGKRGKLGFYAASAVVVLSLSLFASIRSPTVGTDTAGYAFPLYDLAASSETFSDFYSMDWPRAWGWSRVDTIEIGYLVFVWIAAKLGSVQVLLFLTSFFTVGPIYLALAKKRHEVSLPSAYFVFMLLYFNMTLNAMRQWVAMAFIFLALVGVYDLNKPLIKQARVIALIFMACLFHVSAVLAVVPLFLIQYLRGKNIGTRIAIVGILSFALIVALNPAREFLLSSGLIRYANYLGDCVVDFSLPQLILRLPYLMVAIWLYASGRFDERVAGFYVCLAFIGIACGQLATLTNQSGRISHYFDMFYISAVGLLVGRFASLGRGAYLCKLKIDSRCLLIVISISYCVAYWFYSYVVEGAGETIPYLLY